MLNDECCWQGRRDERRDEYFKGFSDFPLWFSCASHAGLKLIKIHLKRGIMKGGLKSNQCDGQTARHDQQKSIKHTPCGQPSGKYNAMLDWVRQGAGAGGKGVECKASWRCGKCGEIFYENCDNILAGFSLVCGLNKCISQKGSVPCLCACVWLQLAALAAALVAS